MKTTFEEVATLDVADTNKHDNVFVLSNALKKETTQQSMLLENIYVQHFDYNAFSACE
ncbi:MAG: hypothetical protein JSR78_04245 [Proteobacteria bacterium]|nr:hypothetical protein [Pseudomonadota bacterium]